MCGAKGFIGWVASLFGLLGNPVVGPGERLVASVMVWEPLYPGLVRGFRESKGFA